VGVYTTKPSKKSPKRCKKPPAMQKKKGVKGNSIKVRTMTKKTLRGTKKKKKLKGERAEKVDGAEI